MSVNGSAFLIRLAVSPFFTMVVRYLYFYRVGYPILRVRTVNDYSAVRAHVGLKIKIQLEVLIFILCPDRLVLHGT